VKEQKNKNLWPKSILEGLILGVVLAVIPAIFSGGFEFGTAITIFLGGTVAGSLVFYAINKISQKTGDKTIDDLLGKNKNQNNDS